MTVAPAGTSRVTTPPAPITESFPTLTPGKRMAPPPIQTLRWVGQSVLGPELPSVRLACGLSRRACLALEASVGDFSWLRRRLGA